MTHAYADGLAVVVPVGPFPANQRWLIPCLESIAAQTLKPAEVILVDDMAGLDEMGCIVTLQEAGIPVVCWRSPWRLGVAHAFNVGVSLAGTERALMLGSDDLLGPEALAACDAAWKKRPVPLGYYWLDVEYLDTGEQQSVPCNAAMVTKALWRHTGGFPVESAVGAPDAALLSIMMGAKGKAGEIIRVPAARPQYFYRRHTETDTASQQRNFGGVILPIRDALTRTWKSPQWGRYE